MTISDMTKGPAGVDELPPWLAARYRSKRHLAALVEIGRALRGVGMTWASLHRVTEEPTFAGAATEWIEYPAGEVLAMVERLERVQPWDVTSSAPMFMRTLRDLAGKDERVALSPRQVGWLEMLLARAELMDAEPPRAPPVEATMQQPNEVDTGNVIQLRPRGRV
jgi:hypothetical protein